MEEWQKTNIMSHYSSLIEQTDPNILLISKLNSIFSLADMDSLEAARGRHAKCMLLYNLAMTRTHGYEALLKGLLETGQTGALNILTQAQDGNVDEFLRCGVTFQGHKVSLGKLLSEFDHENLKRTLRNHLQGQLRIDLLNNTYPVLIKDSVPASLKYYISRRLTSRYYLNPFLFDKQCKDVFVIKQIQLHMLSLLAGSHGTDISTNQLERLTVRFILLEYQEDYESICKVSCGQPVHLIDYNGKQFTWVTTHGDITNLQEYVHQNQDLLNEEAFINQCMQTTHPICISDTPGMGKTMLLASLAHQIMLKYPQKLVRFIVLREFIPEVTKRMKTKVDTDTLADLIADHSSDSIFGREIVKQMLKHSTQVVELFFDGFDEVLSNQVEACKTILKTIITWKSVRVYVTTRPHMRDELENTLGTLGYNILAFREEEQIEFLVKYWEHKSKAENNERLIEFTEKCLITLKQNMNNFERDIAGIPLQCMLLAEVYASQAVKYSKPESRITEADMSAMINITSIFEMYRKLMEMRFERIQRDEGSASIFQTFWKLYIRHSDPAKVFTNAHMFAALQLLFPGYAEKFQTTLVGNRQIETGKLCYIGILEKKETDEDTPRFVHRTFAEYFLGLLVAKILTKQLGFGWWFLRSKTVINSFIQKVLQTTHSLGDLLNSCKIGKFEGIESASFQNPVICYFINAHLKQIEANVNQGCQWADDVMEVYYGLAACSFHDYPALCSKTLEPKAHKELLLKYDVKLADLILLSVKHSSLELFKPLYNFLMENMSKESFQMSSSPEFRITPLHVAVERGHFAIAEFLLNLTKDKGLGEAEANYLIHCCVGGSIADSPATISQKIQIISLFLLKNKECVNEALPDGSPPFLSFKVHIKLLQHLVKSGVDVNVTNNGESILHRITENEISPQNYHDLLLLLLKCGFSKIQTADLKRRVPLHAAVQKIELMEETLKVFLSHGINFNAVDGLAGDSVLFYALKSGRSVNFIRTLISFGADLTHKNSDKANVFHICAGYANLHALEYFLNCNSNEVDMTGVVEKDNTGSTPFIKGLTFGKGLTVHIIKLMEEEGLEITKKVASKGLMSLLCNTNLTTLHLFFDAEFVAVADYLIKKGGVLTCKNKRSPWELDETRKTMESIIQATNCNAVLLEELQKRGIRIDTGAERNSDVLYKELQTSDPQSYEKLCVSLIACNQTKPFVLLKWCLQTDSQNVRAPHADLVGFLI